MSDEFDALQAAPYWLLQLIAAVAADSEFDEPPCCECGSYDHACQDCPTFSDNEEGEEEDVQD